jgi:hypothetical protein
MPRKLPVEVSRANLDHIAAGSTAHLQNVWDALTRQLRDGERPMAAWSTAQFGMARELTITDMSHLQWVLAKIQQQRCSGLQFFALSGGDSDPTPAPGQSLFN